VDCRSGIPSAQRDEAAMNGHICAVAEVVQGPMTGPPANLRIFDCSHLAFPPAHRDEAAMNGAQWDGVSRGSKSIASF
jgi:hypothetical protein